MRFIRNGLVAAVLFGAATNLAAQSPFTQHPGKPSLAQQALDNRMRRFDHVLPNQANQAATNSAGSAANLGGAGIPGLVHNDKPGLQVSSSRIPESIRQRRDEVFAHQHWNQARYDHLINRHKPAGAGFKPDRAGLGQKGKLGKAADNPGMRRADLVSHGQNRRAYTQAERLLAKRLAQIDGLRERYLETGNSKLLDQADQLEQLARRQYEFRLDGRDPLPNGGFNPSQAKPPFAGNTGSGSQTAELPPPVPSADAP